MIPGWQAVNRSCGLDLGHGLGAYRVVPEPPSQTGGVRLTVREPQRFRILVLYIYGLLMIVPVAMAMAATSLLNVGLLPALLPLGVALLTALFLPVGFGNPYIARVVRSLAPGPEIASAGFIVQLALTPRVCGGLRALMEDADDVGWLRVEGTQIAYRGDAIDLEVPRECIENVTVQNVGLRGLFLYQRIRMTLRGNSRVECVDVAERSSWLVTGSRRRTRELVQTIHAFVNTAPAVREAAQPGAPEVGRGAAGK